MRITSGLLVSLVMLTAAGCVSVSELPESPRLQGSMPQNIRVVAIRPTAMTAGTVKNADGLTDAPQFFREALKTALAAKQLGWQIELADQTGASFGDINIATELLTVDGGSAALRFWIGFSAGAAESIVRVTLQDKAGQELATARISERSMCPVGACIESTEATLRKNLQSLASEVADFVINPRDYEKNKTGR